MQNGIWQKVAMCRSQLNETKTSSVIAEIVQSLCCYAQNPLDTFPRITSTYYGEVTNLLRTCCGSLVSDTENYLDLDVSIKSA